MNDELTPLLRDLPEPAPPSSLTAAVMARIESEAERTADEQVAVSASRASELQPWVWSIAGIALVVVLFVNGWISIGALPDFMSSRIGSGRAILVPVQGPLLWLVGVGLLMYLAGLFAPLRSSERD